MFPKLGWAKFHLLTKKVVNQNFRDLFIEDFGFIWLINLFGFV